jgi:hypothetical protein
MRLDAWLKQEHPLAERLRLVERLGQALNAVHDRGEVLAALDPDHVELGTDLRCDLSPATRGKPEPGYGAPERLEGEPPSTAADIYAAGALCWEILTGRPCGEAPKPLAEVAPDLPQELANAVMGCLERSPEWRPKDLTYLAQLAAARQKGLSGEAPTPRAAQPPRGGGASRGSATPRTPPRRASRSHLPLIIAALLLVAAATSSYLWLRQQATPASQPATARLPPAAPTPAPAATAEVAPAPTPSPTTPAVAATEAPAAAASSATRNATPPPATPEPTPTPTPAPTPAPAVVTEPQEAPREAPPELTEPALLTTLSPLSVRRPGRVLLDIHGSGLRSDQHARVLPLKEAPRGITVIRQKWVGPTLVNVLLELDGTVTPAIYAIALEDASGGRTNPLNLTITK